MNRALITMLIVAAAYAALPSTAAASCAPRRAVEQLRDADAAFIGRLVERDGERLVFDVDQDVKGVFGTRIEVRDELPGTSVSIAAKPAEQIGLFLTKDGATFRANDCARTTPEVMRAAVARGAKPCPLPRIGKVRIQRRGRRVRVTAIATMREGDLLRLEARWSDDRVTRLRLRGRRRAVEVARRLARGKSMRLTLSVDASAPKECGFIAISRRLLKIRPR